ncbi:CRISPR-associated endonuclease Cas2 [bacterium]|nr:CRISPR-associated endonuclease Cas2 [bacterium]MBU1782750.1 CRISPR-associated endonuclease Cas2 [bacterium]
MQILVAYDVVTETSAGRKRLRKVAQACKNYGQRVQKSVFECNVNQMQYEIMLRNLLKCIDEKEDNLRIYRLKEPKEEFAMVYGINRTIDFDAPLII